DGHGDDGGYGFHGLLLCNSSLVASGGENKRRPGSRLTALRKLARRKAPGPRPGPFLKLVVPWRGAGRSRPSPRLMSTLLPRIVRVVGRHVGSALGGARTEVLLVDGAVVVDDERHHAGVAVFRRPRDEAEAADHLALHHVVLHAARRGRSLPGEDLVVVA